MANAARGPIPPYGVAISDALKDPKTSLDELIAHRDHAREVLAAQGDLSGRARSGSKPRSSGAAARPVDLVPTAAGPHGAGPGSARTLDRERRHPVHVVWELTLACNLRCAHCGSRAGRPRRDELTARRDPRRDRRARRARHARDQPDRRRGLSAPRLARHHPRGGRRRHPMRAADRRPGADPRQDRGRGRGRPRCRRSLGRRQRGGARSAARRPRQLPPGAERDRGIRPRRHHAGLQHPDQPAVGAGARGDLRAIYAAGARLWQIQLTVPAGNAAEQADLILQPWQIPETYDTLARLFEKGRTAGFRLFAGNNIGYFGPHEHLWRTMTDEPAYWDGCGAAETGLAIEADGAIKGCPSLHKGEYGGGNVRDAPLAELWAAMQDTARPNVERPAWGFCGSCYYQLGVQIGLHLDGGRDPRRARQQPDVRPPRPHPARRRPARALRAGQRRARRAVRPGRMAADRWRRWTGPALPESAYPPSPQPSDPDGAILLCRELRPLFVRRRRRLHQLRRRARARAAAERLRRAGGDGRPARPPRRARCRACGEAGGDPREGVRLRLRPPGRSPSAGAAAPSEPSPIASRYLATVRRAMSKPSALSISTSWSSERIVVGLLGGDQGLDPALHRFARGAVAAVGGWTPRGEEIFELEEAAVAGEIFVRGDPADRRFVHADRLGDRAQGQRLQLRDAVAEEAFLLRDDLGRDLDDGAGALVERLHQPVGALQAFVEPGPGLLVLRAARQLVIIGAVDEQPGQGGAVELDRPAAAAAGDEDVGDDGVDPLRRR